MKGEEARTGAHRLKQIHSTRRHHQVTSKGRVSKDDHPLNEPLDLQIDNIVAIVVCFQ